MNINHLSVSRTQVWDLCKQQYKFKYHLQVPSLEPEPPYFVYGKMVHKVIEEYTKNLGEVGLGQIIQDVLAGHIKLEEKKEGKLSIPDDYMARLPNEMAAFLKLSKQIGTDGILEWPFHYDLDPPHQKIMHGFIDRLIMKDDKIFVIDYKTTRKSKWRKNWRTIVDDLQLRAYAMVVMDHFKIDPKNIKVALYYLDGAELVAAHFTRQTLDATRDYLRNTYNSIVASVPEDVQGNVGSHCTRCDYRKVCPFYKR